VYTTNNDTALNVINPKYIDSINVLKDSTSIKPYGLAGRNGVVEIYLKDEKIPQRVYARYQNGELRFELVIATHKGALRKTIILK